MRNLTPDALAKIANKTGNEPIIIIAVQWKLEGSIYYYADRQVETIPGQILAFSAVDQVITISDNSDSQEVSITLDDTDGKIKTIMDNNDIHKRDVWVYQWFEGLDLDDKFLLFRGKINSPVTWREGEQTVAFSVVSQLEDKEIGFSPEEGQFPFIPQDLIGKPWPIVFGTVVDIPCVQITKAIKGTLCEGLGILSGVNSQLNAPLNVKIPETGMQNIQKRHVSYCASAWLSVDADEYKVYNDQRSELSSQIAKTWSAYQQAVNEAKAQRQSDMAAAAAQSLGPSVVQILGGEDFPRGSITLDIDGGFFSGYFNDDFFHITARSHPENDIAAQQAATAGRITQTVAAAQHFYFASKVPVDTGGTELYVTKGWLVPTTPQMILSPNTKTIAKHFWADAGSKVRLTANNAITHIVSIIPGTVLDVKAYKIFNGVKELISVPNDLYTVTTGTYGSVQAVQIVLSQNLSSIPDQNWADDLYVTFRSDIGPNIVDILTHLISEYTDFTINPTSFDAVKIKLSAFPANFAYLTRKNIVQVLEEIAFQARCSLRLVNGIFYLCYLAEEPTACSTITEDDIAPNSIVLSLTPTEEIVTKYTAKWKAALSQSEPNKMILRHNVKKYGIQEEEYDYYIYNQPDIILKVATFWLIRKANTWKQVSFQTFLHKLNLETFDTVLLDFNKEYCANSDVKALIQSADFDSQSQTIDMQCWLPVKSGTMTPYIFAWPADVSVTQIFPTTEEVTAGFAGGDGPGSAATGTLPVGEIPRGVSSVWYNPAEPWRHYDRGDPKPTDKEFEAAPVSGIAADPGEIGAQKNPNPDLSIKLGRKVEDPKSVPLPPSANIISLEETKVMSKYAKNVVTHFSALLKINKDEEKLGIKTASTVIGEHDGSDVVKTFDFKYDETGEVWGAGTAFLKDEEEPA